MEKWNANSHDKYRELAQDVSSGQRAYRYLYILDALNVRTPRTHVAGDLIRKNACPRNRVIVGSSLDSG